MEVALCIYRVAKTNDAGSDAICLLYTLYTKYLVISTASHPLEYGYQPSEGSASLLHFPRILRLRAYRRIQYPS